MTFIYAPDNFRLNVTFLAANESARAGRTIKFSVHADGANRGQGYDVADRGHTTLFFNASPKSKKWNFPETNPQR